MHDIVLYIRVHVYINVYTCDLESVLLLRPTSLLPYTHTQRIEVQCVYMYMYMYNGCTMYMYIRYILVTTLKLSPIESVLKIQVATGICYPGPFEYILY